jgi:hypothetical protein
VTAVVQRHGLHHSPVGLWQFDGDLNDSSGNGFHLTVESGAARYTNIFPGLRALLIVDPLKLIYNVAEPVLRITGNLTIEMLLQLSPAYEAGKFLCSHTATGETSDTNALYQIDMVATTSENVGLFSESGAGVNASYSITLYPPLSLCHFAVTRVTNVVQFYLNGRTLGAASGTLTTPTDGTSGRFRVGSSTVAGTAPSGILSSLKVLNIGLTSGQILDEFNRTLGAYSP